MPPYNTHNPPDQTAIRNSIPSPPPIKQHGNCWDNAEHFFRSYKNKWMPPDGYSYDAETACDNCE